jgi:hypothetical protein
LRSLGKPAADKAKLVKQRIAEAAGRALAEAEERRSKAGETKPLPKERGGRQGLEPTRYGDWEKKGLISDF